MEIGWRYLSMHCSLKVRSLRSAVVILYLAVVNMVHCCSIVNDFNAFLHAQWHVTNFNLSA